MRWIKFTKDLCILVEELPNSMVFEGLVPLLSVWVKVHSLGLLFPLKQFCAWFMQSFGSVVILCFILFSPFLCLPLEESIEANPGEIFQSNPDSGWAKLLVAVLLITWLGRQPEWGKIRVAFAKTKRRNRSARWGRVPNFLAISSVRSFFKDTGNGWNCSSWF